MSKKFTYKIEFEVKDPDSSTELKDLCAPFKNSKTLKDAIKGGLFSMYNDCYNLRDLNPEYYVKVRVVQTKNEDE